MDKYDHISNIIDAAINQVKNKFNDNVFISYNFEYNSIDGWVYLNKSSKNFTINVEKCFKYYNEKDDDDERYIYHIYKEISRIIEDNWLKFIYR